MPAFLHERVLRLEALLARSSGVLAAYHDAALDVAAQAAAFLDEAVGVQHALGRVDAENELQAARAELAAARHGIDPATFERVTTRRNELARTSALRVMLRSAERLRLDVGVDARVLAEGRDQLTPLVLRGLQKGLFVLPADHDLSQDEIEARWRTLLDDAETGLAARQLLARVSAADVLLLFADLATSLR